MSNLSNKPIKTKFTLEQVNAILFAGVNYTIPEDTINILNYLTTQIGSNAFITSNI
jgi:hypothetical protein